MPVCRLYPKGTSSPVLLLAPCCLESKPSAHHRACSAARPVRGGEALQTDFCLLPSQSYSGFLTYGRPRSFLHCHQLSRKELSLLLLPDEPVENNSTNDA